MPSDGRKCKFLQEAVWVLQSDCHLLIICCGTTCTSTSDSCRKPVLWKFPHLCFLRAKLKIQSIFNSCIWCWWYLCWKPSPSHCNHVRMSADPTRALCIASHTHFNGNCQPNSLRPLPHTLVLREITSTHGFHGRMCNLRYCFALFFSLKAQKHMKQGFKMLSEMELSNYRSFVLLFESLWLHCNSKDVSREKHNKSWARNPYNKAF